MPLDLLDRLVARRSSYGIGFHKRTLVEKRGARVGYLDRGSPQQLAVQTSITSAMLGGVDRSDPIWAITPYIDFVSEHYSFAWEREWRVAGGMRFTPEEVAFLFVPAQHHDVARAFFAGGGGGSGPSYSCPILDPSWSDAQMQNAIATLPAR